MWNRLILALFAVALLGSSFARAAYEDDLHTLQERWAAARYQSSGDEQKKQFEALIKDADALAAKNSDRADIYIWAAVIRGSLAEAANNLSALGTVKEARANLEKSLAMDPKADEGYAYGVLGLMYSKVPGWPVAFGDKKKAKELLLKGLEVAPDGMNTNYFYAQFLFEQDEFKQAQLYIDKAAKAKPPLPPEKSLAVANRLREIQELSDKIKAKVK
jgi:tetratricopeptide (TPR) repeat protein